MLSRVHHVTNFSYAHISRLVCLEMESPECQFNGEHSIIL